MLMMVSALEIRSLQATRAAFLMSSFGGAGTELFKMVPALGMGSCRWVGRCARVLGEQGARRVATTGLAGSGKVK